ncbi:photosynthetic complex putative assembly protein PuhB [Qipengyuania qiaonensis]|uniref:PH domain-containing protein n=1 Tax=Qipengyuania qiaonensis TaxID=2867240 RepID=A0ABS7JCY2_9SPHN|nr:photosynthetic complex putative assembly protein PuhB [Qipengyuania qiaonensis]MBX7483538.1 PH domain-containing protein [Qipengyuania qiaonensis]
MTKLRSMAQIRSLGTPQGDERILWEGKPDLQTLARTAFHTRTVAVYFLVLIVTAVALGSIGGAIITLGVALVTLGLLYSFAWLAARTTSYILTDRRLILNIGMAVEKSVNLPLKLIGAAHLTDRGSGTGDIAIEPLKGHGLGYAMLWPHARPLRFSKPQPMLRAIPGVAEVAAKLAAATAEHEDIALTSVLRDNAATVPADGLKEALA